MRPRGEPPSRVHVAHAARPRGTRGASTWHTRRVHVAGTKKRRSRMSARMTSMPWCARTGPDLTSSPISYTFIKFIQDYARRCTFL